jgi:hypothetical protein
MNPAAAGSAGAAGAAGSSGAGGAAGASCATMMFDKYGADAFVAVRDSIVTKALAAPTAMLGDAFQNFASSSSSAQIDAFKQNLADFLVMVYGGPNNYHGATMEQAHAGLAITSDQYDYFIGNVVVPALSENGVSTDDISNCFAVPLSDPTFKASIVGK